MLVFLCFWLIFGHTWHHDPSRTAGLVLQCRLHQKSARQIKSKATPRHSDVFVFAEWFSEDWESVILEVWAAPGAPETLAKGVELCPPAFLKGLQGPRGHQDPPKCPISNP